MLLFGLARKEPDPVPRHRRSLLGFAIVVYNIMQVSYRQAICPPRLQGRMNSVDALHRLGHDPARTLLGGVLGSTIGLRETLVVGAVGTALSVLWILLPQRSPARDARAHRGRGRRTTELGAALPGVADPLSPLDEPA